MIASNGTLTSEHEKQLVSEAVDVLNDPQNWNKHLKQFEEDFADYIGAKYILPVTNGTAALHLALLALDIGPGDEVILPNLGFVSAAFAVTYTGAKPVFADVNSVNWTLNPIKLPVTERTKAIMPVYMYGQKPNIEALKQYKLPIIEDACPAVGVKGVATTEVSCFSFQGAKTLAIGEGGMLVTNSKETYERAKKISNLGKSSADFDYDEIGYNYRMSNIQAALGLGQLRHIEEILEAKRNIHKWYGDYCSQQFGPESVPWMNSLLVRTDRGLLRQYLDEQQIETRNVFPMMSSYPMYKTNKETPVAEQISNYAINLPSASYLTRNDIENVKASISAYYN